MRRWKKVLSFIMAASTAASTIFVSLSGTVFAAHEIGFEGVPHVEAYSDTVNNASVKDANELMPESTYGYLLSYVVSEEPNMQISGTDNTRTDVLHLALSEDGKNFTALNNQKAVFYPSKDQRLGSPSLFRKPDGTYGLIASQNNSNSNILVFDSEDLLYYSNQRVVKLNNKGIVVTDPVVVYDSSIMAYQVFWKDKSGAGYMAETTDFVTFSDAAPTDYNKQDADEDCILPDYAIETSVFELTKEEYDRINNKYGKLYNTGIKKMDDIVINSGERVKLPETVTAEYSDGSTKIMGVNWKTQGFDFSKDGEYTVIGTVQQTTYNDPLVEMRADPYMIYNEEDGYYYFTGSYPTMNDAEDKQRIGYDRLVIRRAQDINDLTEAEEVTVWRDGQKDENTGIAYYRYFWAPEMHKIGDKWRIITFASLNSSTVWGNMVIFTCEDGDIMNPDSWTVDWKGTGENGVVKAATDGKSLGGFDTTFMEVNGQCYYVTPKDGKIWITTFDADDPLTPTGPLVQLSEADMSWECNLRTNQAIDEGPAILRHNGKVYIIYSGSTVDQHYCLGMIYADEDSNLTNPASWKKYPYPLLSTADVFPTKNQYGPGHNSFSVDENGNVIIIYHARTWGEIIEGANNDGGLNDPGRHARVKSVHFAADGFPVLNMTEEEELSADNKTVSIKVTVKGKVTVTYKAGTGGNISGTAIQTIYKGGNTSAVTAIANEGYEFTKWSDGITTADRMDKNVAESKTVTAVFTKKAVPVKVSLNKKKVTLGKGESFTLKATVTPDGVSQKVTWKSNKESVVKVTKAGKITAKKAGKATITATAVNGEKVSCVVTVKKAPGNIRITTKPKTLKKGQTLQLKVKLPKNTASYVRSFTSSKKTVATVTSKGKVKAVKRGTATITVRTFNKKKATIKIQVK